MADGDLISQVINLSRGGQSRIQIRHPHLGIIREINMESINAVEDNVILKYVLLYIITYFIQERNQDSVNGIDGLKEHIFCSSYYIFLLFWC